MKSGKFLITVALIASTGSMNPALAAGNSVPPAPSRVDVERALDKIDCNRKVTVALTTAAPIIAVGSGGWLIGRALRFYSLDKAGTLTEAELKAECKATLRRVFISAGVASASVLLDVAAWAFYPSSLGKDDTISGSRQQFVKSREDFTRFMSLPRKSQESIAQDPVVGQALLKIASKVPTAPTCSSSSILATAVADVSGPKSLSPVTSTSAARTSSATSTSAARTSSATSTSAAGVSSVTSVSAARAE